MFDKFGTDCGASVILITVLIGACDDEVIVEDDAAAEEDEDEDGYDDGESVPNDVPIEDAGPEPCGKVGDSRPCDDDQGIQFCVHNERWGECLSSYECLPGEQRECGLAAPVTCLLGADGMPYFPDCPFTPLVLSFEGGPIELRSNAASFAMDAAGMCLATDWPAAANPWLAIDLDGNGFVDGGHELFGSGTVLASGRRAQNGFVALAALDRDGDGRVDASDPGFAELLIWRDEDGDKRSLPGELSSLADAGVEALELGYSVREICDARGNCGRERAGFEFVRGGERRVGELVDLHLSCW